MVFLSFVPTEPLVRCSCPRLVRATVRALRWWCHDGGITRGKAVTTSMESWPIFGGVIPKVLKISTFSWLPLLHNCYHIAWLGQWLLQTCCCSSPLRRQVGGRAWHSSIFSVNPYFTIVSFLYQLDFGGMLFWAKGTIWDLYLSTLELTLSWPRMTSLAPTSELLFAQTYMDTCSCNMLKHVFFGVYHVIPGTTLGYSNQLMWV